MSNLCPSCDSDAIIGVNWTDHEFQYGTDENHVMLKCQIPVHTCPSCGEKWTDHHAEDIIEETIRVHLSPVVIDDEWMVEASLVAYHADAYNVHQVVRLMKSSKVPVDEMDEWCAQGREDYPCLFKSNIVEGLWIGKK